MLYAATASIGGHRDGAHPRPRTARSARCRDRSGPLTDVRIIDLTAALAGPFCTMLLADLGADVIKVEPPKGDFTRSGGPFTTGDTERNYGGYFASVNRSKRSIVLDLQQESDRETLKDLVRDADVVVENFRVGVLDRLGIGYEDLAGDQPADRVRRRARLRRPAHRREPVRRPGRRSTSWPRR